MEGRAGSTSGVTVIGAEAPSNYHVAPRNENPSLGAGLVSVAGPTVPVYVGSGGTETGKKKRGRPRKHRPDGTVSMALVPFSVSPSAPLGTGDTSAAKRGKGRPLGSENMLQNRLESENLDELVACASGASFMPHIITVNAGEDVTMKIISFSQQGPRAICILSANGAISNVTLHQPDSSGGTLTYEGRFEILSLSGSFMPSESGGTRSRAGGLSVSLASPDGRVVGGGVAGLLVAASPVQVVVGSFLPKDHQEQKPKKLKTVSTRPTIAFPSSNPEKEHDSLPTVKPDPTPSSSFQRESWATMHSLQDSRKSATDINISLPGG